MPKYVPIMIKPGDVETARKQTSQELNRLGQKLAQSDNRTADLNLGGNRVTSVADPGNPTDAVNLRYLKKKLDDLTQQQHFRQKRIPYSIVFSNSSAIVAGQFSAPYIMMPGKNGVPNFVKVACIPQGTGTGNAQFNIARNGTNVLASDLVVPAGTQGPITVTNFIAGTSFNLNDLITPVVNIAGGMSFVTIEVEVQPSGN
jgi:hypothetical protein